MFAHIRKNIFTDAKLSAHVRKMQITIPQMCKCANHKCANVQKCVVHKMRKSAAQIIFQMQKLQFAQIHKCTILFFVCAQILSSAEFFMCKFCCVHNSFLCK